MNKKLKLLTLGLVLSLLSFSLVTYLLNTQKFSAVASKDDNTNSSISDSDDITSTNTDDTTTNITNENSSENSNDGTYELTKSVYKNNAITINYPQITSLENDNMQAQINELIKNEALSYISSNVNSNLSLAVNYNITLKSSDILSIQYSGVSNVNGAAHPTNVFYTTNINIKDGKKLKLSDVVNVDDNFISSFKKGKYIDWESTTNSEDIKNKQKEISNYINTLDSNTLTDYFNNADSMDISKNPSNTFSYLTKNSIVISINVPHAIGDHAEYEISSQGIQNNYKINI